MVNRVILIGNLGADPELKTTEGGRSRTTFNLATNRTYTTSDSEKVEETTWHRIICWGKLAEVCGQYLEKGRTVFVEGRIRNYSVEDGDVKKWYTEIVADTVRFLGKKNGNGHGAENAGAGAPDDDVPF